MFLIDKPFASDYLIQTIKSNKYQIVLTREAQELIQDDSLSWISEEQAAAYMRENPETPLYTNSENALTWIDKHLPDSVLAKQARLFKDKVKFRELIRGSYPGFFFKTVTLRDIPGLSLEDLPLPFVIKPSVGFFSIGVHVVKSKEDWALAKKELSIETLEPIYPANVLDTSVFIIEEYIEGEEFAIDCYFNPQGEVVILNILHHKFSSGEDTSDRVYSTSMEIVQKYQISFGAFLQSLGEQAGLHNFPAHVEVRINKEGRIHPIEVNPLRFGGWCTTADLLGLATGTSPYELYMRNEKPDWSKIFKDREDKLFSIIVLNNNSGYAPGQIKRFDYELLGKEFEKTLMIRELDITLYAVFGFLFAETSPGNKAELHHILISDLRKYITLK